MSEYGTVKWFNADKGYGFIVPDQGSGDVFFHVTTLTKCGIGELNQGDRVQYETRVNPTTHKVSAQTITLANAAASAPHRS